MSEAFESKRAPEPVGAFPHPATPKFEKYAPR
jgi:hypothetical protein